MKNTDILMVCKNSECLIYDEYYFATLVKQTIGACPPHGPCGGLHVEWSVEDEQCPQCGEEGSEV